VQNIFSLPAFQQAERLRPLFEFLDDSKQLEKENPALVAERDRAVVELRKERIQKELVARSQSSRSLHL
jgi:hypothetical protein